MEKVLWLIEHVKSDLQSFVLEISRWQDFTVGRPVEVGSDQIETLIENNQCCTTWERADILKISKSIKFLVKMKNVSFILWEKPYRLFGQPSSLRNTSSSIIDNPDSLRGLIQYTFMSGKGKAQRVGLRVRGPALSAQGLGGGSCWWDLIKIGQSFICHT